MSRSLRLTLIPALLGLAFTPLPAQEDAPRMYLVADHMKVCPGKEQAYVELELGPWKRIHEARLKAGKIVSWHLYRVRYPSGTNAPHTYVTITIYPDFNSINDSYVDLPTGSDPLDWEQVFQDTLAARDLVCTEVWDYLDGVTVEGQPAFIEVNYMKVPAMGDGSYLAAEMEVWKPIHAALKAAGRRAGWGVYALRLPRGDGLAYNYATVDFYDAFGQLEGGLDADILQAAHPGSTADDWTAMMGRTSTTRTLVRAEVWELVDSVVAAAQ